MNPLVVSVAAGRAMTTGALVAFAWFAVAVAARSAGLPAMPLVLLAAGTGGWTLWWFLPLARARALPVRATGVAQSRPVLWGLLARVEVTPSGAAAGNGTLVGWCVRPPATLTAAPVQVHAGPGRRSAVVSSAAVLLPVAGLRPAGRRPLQVGAAPDRPR